MTPERTADLLQKSFSPPILASPTSNLTLFLQSYPTCCGLDLGYWWRANPAFILQLH